VKNSVIERRGDLAFSLQFQLWTSLFVKRKTFKKMRTKKALSREFTDELSKKLKQEFNKKESSTGFNSKELMMLFHREEIEY
jgi:hypothetical protein